jgi:hypothetical protein
MNSNLTITYAKKILPSGNIQVKFFIKEGTRDKYGYLLTEGYKSEGEIINEIRQRLMLHYTSKADLQRFSFTREFKDDHNFYLYSA